MVLAAAGLLGVAWWMVRNHAEGALMTLESFDPKIGSWWWNPQLASARHTDADGVARFTQLPPRECVVVVSKPQFVALDQPLVRLGGTAQRRVEIALAPTIERGLTVRSSDGQPLAGVRVGLWHKVDQPTPEGAAQSTRWSSTSGNGTWPEKLVAMVVTDAAGRCQLQGPPGAACTLRLAIESHAPLARDGVMLASVPEPWVEVLADGAVVEGRLEIAVTPLITLLRLQRADGSGEVFPESWAPRVVAADGAFRLRGCPPGSWQLQLLTPGDGIEHLADVSDLRDRETRRVTIDGSKLRRAEISGTLAWNGRPHSGWVRLVRVDAGNPGHTCNAPVEDGRFRVTLAPGRYRATISHGVGGSGGLPVGDDLLLAPGSKIECALHLRTRAVRLRLLRHGLPLVRAAVRAVVDTRFELSFDPTDDYGCSEFAVPLGVHPLVGLPRLGYGRARPPVPLGNIEVSAGEGPQIIEVNVPGEFGR